MIKWKKWQKRGKLRVKKEFALTRAAWRNVVKQRRRYVVQMPKDSATEKELSIHTEDSQYETDLSTDEILIADVSDVKNKKELSEKVSETLLQLLDIYLPDEIYGEFEDTDEGEEFHEHPGSPKVTFTEKKHEPTVELAKEELQYPETIESKKRYRTRYLNEAEYEKRKTIEAIKQRIEELNLLKGELLKQDRLYKCHLADRQKKEEVRKKKFLEKLAKEKPMKLDILTRIGDKLYKTYKENVKNTRNAYMEYLDKEIKSMNLILKERCRELDLNRNLPREKIRYSKSTLIEPHLNLSSDSEKNETIIREKVRRKVKKKIKKPKKIEELDEVEVKRKLEAEKADVPKISQVVEEQKPIESPVLESLTSLQPPSMPKLVSVFDPDIIDKFKELDILLNDAEGGRNRWYASMEQLPVELYISTVPKSILFESFIPYNIYRKKFTIINETIQKIHFKPFDVKTVPLTSDRDLIKVEPGDDCSLLPGKPAVKEIIFSPLADTQNLDAEVRFFTRRNQTDIREFKLLIKCTQQRAVPVLSTTFIKFPTQKVWTKQILRKVLTITNIGGLPFVGHIHSVHTGLEDSASESIDSSLHSTSTSKSTKSNPDSTTRSSILSGNSSKSLEKSRWIAKKKKKNVLTSTTKSILDDIINDVTDYIRVQPKYFLPVPSGEQFKVEIQFSPSKVPFSGPLRRNYKFNFDGINVENSQQMLTIEAKTEEGPFQLDTVALDMKTCVSGGVFQTPFNVKNNGYLTYQLLVKIPRQLTNHMCVTPSAPIVKPGSITTILVKLAPKWTFLMDLGKYYDPETSVFEIPIRVTSKNEEDTGAPLVVHAIGSLSRCMGIRISPKDLNLGVVTTSETVIANLYLFNYSTGACYYGFLNLPKFIIIQPNYGFGRINGSQSVKLHILYSPIVELLERSGQSVRHVFSLYCTTVDRLVCEPPNVVIRFDEEEENKTHSVFEVKFSVEGFQSTHLLSINPHSEKRRKRMIRSSSVNGIKSKKNVFSLHFPDLHANTSGTATGYSSATDVLVKQKKSRKVLPPSVRIESKNEVQLDKSEDISQFINPPTHWEVPEPLYDSVTITAIIIDPLCELSAQKVIMPPTPYYSYSMASIYIRAVDSIPFNGYCGKIKSLQDYSTSNVMVRYEFFSNRIQLEVQPCNGKFKLNESAKIFFILRPFLHPPDIDSNARRLKAERVKQELIEQWKEDKLKKEKMAEELKQKRASKRASKRMKFDEKEKKEKKPKEEKKERRGKKRKKNASVISTKVPKFFSKSGLAINGKADNNDTADNDEPPEFVIDLKKLTIDKRDILTAKVDLLKSLEPTGFEARVTCLVETSMLDKPFTVRQEVLYCNVICPITIPNMIVSTAEEGSVLNFGAVAIGTKARKWVHVHNTSGHTIFVNRTILDTNGLFYCPFTISRFDALKNYRGIMVEPDHTLELPVFFQPQQEQTEMRFFELISDNTVIQLKVTGKGVTAHYSIKPQFLYAHLSAAFEGREDLVVVIENDCDAPLSFSFKQLCTRAGYVEQLVVPATEPSLIERDKEDEIEKEKQGDKEDRRDTAENKRKKRRTTIKKEKPSNKHVEYSMGISENLISSVESNFEEIKTPKPLFLFPDVITVQPRSKEKFSIEFLAPPLPKVEDLGEEIVQKLKEKTQQRSKKNKGRLHKKGLLDLKHEIAMALEKLEKKIYMTEIRLYVGDVNHVLDWTVFGYCEKEIEDEPKQSETSGKEEAVKAKKKKFRK